METEYDSNPGKKYILSLALVGVILAAALAGEFVFKLQPGLGGGGGTIASGTVIMPSGVGTSQQLNFQPSTITVIVGLNNTVTFKNEDNSAPAHTVTARDGSFNSLDIKPGESWTHTFTAPGNFSYYCVYHSWMVGKVIVKPAGAGGTIVNIPAGTASNQLNYVPSHFTVVVGVNNTVTFVNHDTATHTVTALDGSFNSGDILAGKTWTHTFTTTGTFSFHCIYHSFMTGQVTVVSGS
jgi:plastocyanin